MVRAMHAPRKLAILALGLACVALALRAPGATAQPARLDASLRAMLAGLEVQRGGDIAPADLAGRAVIVAFFASWCAPCRLEFIELREVIRRMGPERIKVVAVNWLEDIGHYPAGPLRLARTLDRLDPHITALEGTRAVARAFGGPDGIAALPASFAFDARGRAVLRFVYDGDPGRAYTRAGEFLAALG